MHRKLSKAAIALLIALIALVSLSKESVDKLRMRVVGWLAFAGEKPETAHVAIEKFQLENQLLKNELKALRQQFGDDLGYIFYLDFDVVPAKVIFRSPAAWDSTLWINVGKATNAQLGRDIVLHNSPVVVGRSIVGVVDYVGEQQSRVRLITDSGLTPSVRVSRNNLLLAKGELRGISQPLWRTQKPLLKGSGFNYDFADEKGPAQDLRSGNILRQGDLLVTTGLDGVFPPNLQAARITKVYPLREGDAFYEVDAQPTATELDELSYLFVLKPIGYDPSDS